MTTPRALAPFLLLPALACGGSSPGGPSVPPPPPPPPAPVVATIAMAPDSTALRVGGTVQIAGTPKTAAGAVVPGKTLAWETSTPTVVSVSTGGLVTTIGAGRGVVTASVDGKTGTAIVTVQPGLDTLPGAGGNLAGPAMVEKAYHSDPAKFDSTGAGVQGVLVSGSVLFVGLVPGATIAQVNDLIKSLNADVIGSHQPGSTGLGGWLVLQLTTNTHEAMNAAIALASGKPGVLSASRDLLFDLAELPRSSTPATSQWGWPALGLGNWGFQVARIPEMWNLNDYFLGIVTLAPKTIVVDGHFAASHPDVPYARILEPDVMGGAPPSKAAYHGTQVASVIGAKWGNGVGIDGVDPFALLAPFGHRGPFSFADLMQDLLKALLLEPAGRVVTMTNTISAARVAAQPALQQTLDAQGIVFRDFLQELEHLNGRTPVFVVAVGNDNGAQAVWSSPMAQAARRWNWDEIILVEASWEGPPVGRAPFSNVDGHVSAPGASVKVAFGDAGYSVSAGTSFAAGFVAGIVSYLFALDPTLDEHYVKELLVNTAFPASGGAPHVDGFAAAMSIPGRIVTLRRALLDIDDGSIDGNRRIRDDGSVDLNEDTDGDGKQGDGKIDMSDFRRFRDGVLEALDFSLFTLDGASNHPKKDLNRDGLFTTVTEGYGARMDFNGDGGLMPDAVRKVPGFAGGPFTDLEVLQTEFDDPEYRKEDLLDLLYSGDLFVGLAQCAGLPLAANVRLRNTGESVTYDHVFGTGGFPKEITARTPQTPYRASVEVFKADGQTILATDSFEWDPAPGSDTPWPAICRGVEIEALTNFATMLPGETRAVTFRVKIRDIAQGTFTLAANTQLIFASQAGVQMAVFGLTDAQGEFTTDVTLTGSQVGSFVASAEHPDGPFGTTTFNLGAVTPPVFITSSFLTPGHVGQAYSWQLQASGGNGSFSWSIASGALAPGLTLLSNGHVQGTPTLAGTYNLVVRASSGLSSAQASTSVTIAPADPWTGLWAGPGMSMAVRAAPGAGRWFFDLGNNRGCVVTAAGVVTDQVQTFTGVCDNGFGSGGITGTRFGNQIVADIMPFLGFTGGHFVMTKDP